MLGFQREHLTLTDAILSFLLSSRLVAQHRREGRRNLGHRRLLRASMQPGVHRNGDDAIPGTDRHRPANRATGEGLH